MTAVDLWVRRPYTPSDEDGIVYLWLKSFERSQWVRRFAFTRFNVANDADIPAEVIRAYWSEHREVVMWLLQHADIEILCDRDNPEVIWAFACTSGDTVHYILAKRRFHQAGVSAALFRELLGSRLDRPCSFTHELVEFRRQELRDAKLRVPESWHYDVHVLAQMIAASAAAERKAA